MLIRAEQRYLRTSAKKLRFVAYTIKKIKSPTKAVAYLEMTQKRAAEPLAKAIKQALGNAKNTYGINAEDLKIRELLINEGPSYKRGQPVSRGMSHPILKQTSHIRVILESVEKKEVQNVQNEKIKDKNEKRQSKSKKGEVK